MDYQRQEQILTETFKQACNTYTQQPKEGFEKYIEATLIFLLEQYAYKVDIIRLKAKKNEPLTDIEKECRDKRKKRAIRQLKRELKESFARCKKMCGADRYYQIKQAFSERRKALQLDALQSKDNVSALDQVVELENTTHELGKMKPESVVLKSKL